MATRELLAQLGCWEGYEVEACWEEQRGTQRWCVVRLRPVASRERECSGCGGRVAAVHDCEERRVRDLPIFEVPIVSPCRAINRRSDRRAQARRAERRDRCVSRPPG